MPCSCHKGLACVECTPHVTAHRIEVSGVFFVVPRSAETAVRLPVGLPIDCRALAISHTPHNQSELTNPPPYFSFVVSCNSICCRV